MIKITFMGAGSFVLQKNVLGDCLMCDELIEAHAAAGYPVI